MALSIRLAQSEDAQALWRAVDQCPELDANSFYCYWLLCREFGSSCVVAEDDGRLLGFAVGFSAPERPETLFVWQLYVDAGARRLGLAGRLLDRLLEELEPRFVEATVAPDNTASLGAFRALARRQGGAFNAAPCLAAEDFPGGTHGPELLVQVSIP